MAINPDHPLFADVPAFTQAAPYRADMPWDHAVDKIAKWESELNLQTDPDFQRAHVWNKDKQIKYVEYILRDGQSSRDLYFNHPQWMGNWKGDFVLVDGKQRLHAVTLFMTNNLPIFGGYYLRDFQDKLSFRCSFVFNVNTLKTRKQVLQWYLDLNEGGVVHTQLELDRVRLLLADER